METLSRTQARSWQGLRKELVSSSHTLPCYLSMPRSRVEAGKKQPRRSLEYGYSKERCSFTPPLVFLYSSFGLLMVTRRMHATFTEDPRSSLGGVLEFIRRCTLCGLLWFADLGCHFCVLRLNSVDGLIIVDCFRLSVAHGCD